MSYDIYQTVIMCGVIAGGGYMIYKKALQVKKVKQEKAGMKNMAADNADSDNKEREGKK